MSKVVGVKFRNSAKVYYFSPNDLEDLEVGEYVIVETVRGQEAGTVAFAVREVDEKEIPGRLKGILRRATALDLTQMERYQQEEAGALCRCREQVAEHKLPMKVIRAEYNFDGSYLTFYFTAEKRVDFRALVKELARIFQARIELRQVGVRDEVRLLGGYGLVWPPALLFDVDDRVSADLDPHGQAAEPASQPDGDLGRVWPFALLPGLRERLLCRGQKAYAAHEGARFRRRRGSGRSSR